MKAQLRRRHKRKPTHREILRHCRRCIPPPATLRANVCAVLEKWVKRDRDILTSTGTAHLSGNGSDSAATTKRRTIFFNTKFASVKRRQFAHICRHIKEQGPSHLCDESCRDCGCLSDPAGVDVNFAKPSEESSDSDGSKPRLYFTGRCASQNEVFHRSLRASVLARNVGALRCAALVGTHIFQWNIRRGIEKRGDLNYFTYHLGLLFLINSLFAAFIKDPKKLPFPKLQARMRDHLHDELGLQCLGLFRQHDDTGELERIATRQRHQSSAIDTTAEFPSRRTVAASRGPSSWALLRRWPRSSRLPMMPTLSRRSHDFDERPSFLSSRTIPMTVNPKSPSSSE